MLLIMRLFYVKLRKTCSEKAVLQFLHVAFHELAQFLAFQQVL